MSDIVKIAIIDSNSMDLFIMSIEPKSITDEDGDLCEEKIIDKFNKNFDLSLRESEISWGVVDRILIDFDNNKTTIS